MTEKPQNNQETAAHIRRAVRARRSHFSWVTDGCTYEQHIRFVKHRNDHWDGEGSFEDFCLRYAAMLEDDDD